MIRMMLGGLLAVLCLFQFGCSTMCPCAPTPPVKRVGMVTGIKPDKIAYYKELHAKPWPGVVKMIRACNIRKFSIYLHQIEGQYFLFGYYEYVGRDFKADMAKMAADPETQRWWKETDPCQSPLPMAAEKNQIWTEIEEVFHSDGAKDVIPDPACYKRFGTITGLKYEKEEEYRTLHQTTWPGVLKQIKEANIRNYSIYLVEIQDKLYLMSYLEYAGKSMDSDFANIGKDATTRRWWKHTDPCQIPLPGAAAKGKIWDDMEEVFTME